MVGIEGSLTGVDSESAKKMAFFYRIFRILYVHKSKKIKSQNYTVKFWGEFPDKHIIKVCELSGDKLFVRKFFILHERMHEFLVIYEKIISTCEAIPDPSTIFLYFITV